GLVPQSLRQMGLAHSGRPQEQDILALAKISPGREFEELLAADAGVELPVKVLERFEGTEVSGLGSPLHAALMANIHLILEDQFQELAVAESTGGGLLKANIQGLGQARKPQL